VIKSLANKDICIFGIKNYNSRNCFTNKICRGNIEGQVNKLSIAKLSRSRRICNGGSIIELAYLIT
jgi:hypothetical protein